jgi:hypothetical protein
MKIRPAHSLLSVLVFALGVGVGGHADAAPPAPTPLAPANGANVLVPSTITWSAVVDPSGAGIIGFNWKVSPSPTANSLGEQGAWSEARSFTVTGVGPGTPVLDPTRGYSTFHPEESITFTWSAVPDAVTYRLEVSDDPAFPLDRVFPNFQTFWNDTVPTNTDGFRWGVSLGEGNFVARVFAVNADNPQDGIRSLPSNVIAFSVFFNNPIGPAPVLLSPTNGETLTLPFALTWAHVPNPQSSGYDGQISSRPTFSTLETPLFAQLPGPIARWGRRCEQTAKPFQWTFTRAVLADLLAKLKAKEVGPRGLTGKYVTVIVKHSV